MGTPWPPAGRFEEGTPTTIRYDEGCEVGYRWFAKTGERPLYAFGHGLTYTSFDYSDLEISGGATIIAKFTVTNIGDRDGTDVPQLY
jgi:beta-glucosidase